VYLVIIILLSVFLAQTIILSVVSRFIKYALFVRYIQFSAISVLLTTENSDVLEIRVPDGSTSLKVTPLLVNIIANSIETDFIGC